NISGAFDQLPVSVKLSKLSASGIDGAKPPPPCMCFMEPVPSARCCPARTPARASQTSQGSGTLVDRCRLQDLKCAPTEELFSLCLGSLHP
ncbi:Hypothetical predicted protein, partial [Marmota monax]